MSGSEVRGEEETIPNAPVLSMRTKVAIGSLVFLSSMIIIAGTGMPRLMSAINGIWGTQGIETDGPEGEQGGPILRVAIMGYLLAASYSPTSDLLATIQAGGIRIRNSSNGRLVSNMTITHIEDYAWSPDGSMIAAMTTTGRLSAWEVLTGREVLRVKAYVTTPEHNYEYGVERFAWSPDGEKIAFPRGYILLVWDLEAMKSCLEVPFGVNLTSIRWSPDGAALAITSCYHILLLDALTGNLTAEVGPPSHSPGPVYDADFSPDGGTLAVSRWGEPYVDLYAVPRGEHLATIRYGSGQEGSLGIHSVKWSSKGMLAMASYYPIPKTVGIYDPLSGDIHYIFDESHEIEQGVYNEPSIEWSPDGSKIAVSGSFAGYVGVWYPHGELVATWQAEPDPAFVSWSHTGDRICTHTYGDHLKIWDLEGDLLEEISQPGTSIGQISWSPDGSMIASKGPMTWNTTDGKLIGSLARPNMSIWGVDWCPADSMIAGLFKNSTVEGVVFMDSTKGEISNTISGDFRPRRIRWSPGGDLVGVGSLGGIFSVYNCSSGEFIWTKGPYASLQTAREPSTIPWDVEWSPDGTKVAGISSTVAHNKEWRIMAEGRLLIWDALDGELLLDKIIPEKPCSLAWSEDGSRIAFTREKISGVEWAYPLPWYIHVMDVQTGALIYNGTLEHSTRDVVWYANGTALITGHDDGLRIWDLNDRNISGHVPADGGKTLRWSRDRSVLAAAGPTTIELWDSESIVEERVDDSMPETPQPPPGYAPEEPEQEEPSPAKINASNLDVLWSRDLVDINLTQSHQSSPTVADLDGDGHKEILLAFREPYGPGCVGGQCRKGGENRLVCLSESGTIKWVFPPLGQPDLSGHPMTTPTITDLDGDGLLEILLGRRDGAVICIDAIGEERWTFTMDGALESVMAEPQLYDNDGDGAFEIYVASKRWIFALDRGGNLLWRIAVDESSLGFVGAEWPPLVWDIDQDGSGDIVACLLRSRSVVCYSAADGSERWRFTIPGGGMLRSTPVCADVDKDTRYEILVAGQDGNFYVLSENGELEWKFDTPTGGELSFTFPVADIDGDANLETAFMDDEMLYCLDLFTRQVEWTFKPMTPSHYSNYNTFADVTGDGEIDVLVVAPLLYVLSNQGNVQAYFDTSKLFHDKRAENGMWSGDINDDGRIEILVKFDGDGLYCLSTGGSYDESKMPWPKVLCNLINRPVVPIGG